MHGCWCAVYDTRYSLLVRFFPPVIHVPMYTLMDTFQNTVQSLLQVLVLVSVLVSVSGCDDVLWIRGRLVPALVTDAYQVAYDYTSY
jgi:hypothetical protein